MYTENKWEQNIKKQTAYIITKNLKSKITISARYNLAGKKQFSYWSFFKDNRFILCANPAHMPFHA